MKRMEGSPTADRWHALRVEAAVLSLGGAAVHAAVIPEHAREYVLFGIFFALTATLQAVSALLLVVRPSRVLYMGTLIGNAALVATWLASRTVGLAIGPDAGSPEEVHVIDSLATAYELLVIVLLGALLAGRASTTRHPTEGQHDIGRHGPRRSRPHHPGHRGPPCARLRGFPRAARGSRPRPRLLRRDPGRGFRHVRRVRGHGHPQERVASAVVARVAVPAAPTAAGSGTPPRSLWPVGTTLVSDRRSSKEAFAVGPC